MKTVNSKFLFLIGLFFGSLLSIGQTISMASGTANSSAFSSSSTVGVDGAATYYLAFDATYMYVGFSGGNTIYSSDMYYIGIDTDPGGTNGNSAGIDGASFASTNNQKLDYYAVYENNSSFYGAPTTNGNAYEVYANSTGSWSFQSRTDGNNNTDSRTNFSSTSAEVRFRIPWSALGSFSPGSSSPIKVVLWTNNSAGDFIWSSFPSANPTGTTTGTTALTMSNGIEFASTASGAATNAGIASPLPVSLLSFDAEPELDANVIKWSTASEKNASHFVLYKSEDAVTKQPLHTEQAKGNSNSISKYAYTDFDIDHLQAFYFLEQVDFDGASTMYGPIKVVRNDKKVESAFFTSDHTLQVRGTELVGSTVRLVSLKGEVLMNQKLTNDVENIVLSVLPSGFYLLNIENLDGSVEVIKLVKTR